MVEEIGSQEDGSPLTKEEVDEILTQLDTNGDGTICFDGATASRDSCSFSPNAKQRVAWDRRV